MSSSGDPVPTQSPEEADLGFGTVVIRQSRRRLLNRDGSFNVRRDGLRPWESLSAYHFFLSISWPRFLGLVALAYGALNAFFAVLYLLCGDGALHALEPFAPSNSFARAFFFSVHTLATIGYGSIVPVSVAANIVVMVEGLMGLIGVTLVAGVVFARIARPRAKIVFSRNAVIAPYRGGRAFMFRITNQHESQLVDLQAKVLLSRRKRGGATSEDREFVPLALERDSVVFFPLSWTIVHHIDRHSPLEAWTAADLAGCDAEFLILLNGFDETFSQTVHARSSYKTEEIVWGARFANLFNPVDSSGVLSIDITKLHDIERVPLG